MKKVFGGLAAILAVAAVVRFVIGGGEDSWICNRGAWVKHGQPAAEKPTGTCGTILIRSPAWKNGGVIPKKYTCDGENISPPLQITNIPAGAKSLAIVLEDPDAPGKTFVHWTVWNVSPAGNIAEGKLPSGGVTGKNNFGKNGYGGPCPPLGRHHYKFQVWALKNNLILPEGSSRGQLTAAMGGLVVGSGEMTGVYK